MRRFSSRRALLGALGFLCVFASGTATAQGAFKKATLHHPHGCSGGTFFDPRNGGECWSCPGGYNRTIFAVDGDKACDKGVFTKGVRAKFHRKTGCSKGTFFDLLTAGCWSCPAGYERSLDLVRSNKACVHKSRTVAAHLQTAVQEFGKTLKNAAADIGSKARLLGQQAAAKLKQVGGDVAGFANRMADGLKEGFSKVVSWAGAAFDKAKEIAKLTGAALVKAAKVAWEKLKEFGKAVADKVMELVNKAIEAILKPLTRQGGIAVQSLARQSAFAHLRREAAPQCKADEGFRFLGIPIVPTLMQAVSKIGLGLIADKVLDKIKAIPDDAQAIYQSARQRVRWAGDKVVKATSSAGASMKSLLARVSAGAIVGGTLAAAAIHAASFATAYPGAYLSCVGVVSEWKKKTTEKERSGGDVAWWGKQSQGLFKSFAKCYENEFVDVFSLDFVWDGFYTLLVTPTLDIPILIPLSIKVGALVTAAVAAAVGALTGGSGAVLGPILGTVAGIVVRAGIGFALNFILKKTPLYTDLWVKKWYPKVFRPIFKKAQGNAPFFFFYDVILPGVMGEHGRRHLVDEVKKGYALSQSDQLKDLPKAVGR